MATTYKQSRQGAQKVTGMSDYKSPERKGTASGKLTLMLQHSGASSSEWGKSALPRSA